MFGVCRPACHDSSLYIFVLILFLVAVVLSELHFQVHMHVIFAWLRTCQGILVFRQDYPFNTSSTHF